MVSALCTLAVVALLAAPASAIIIAADDMEYDAGTLVGKDGGSSHDANNGWDGAWRNGTGFGLGNVDSFQTDGGGQMGAPNGVAVPGVILGIERQIKENQAPGTPFYFAADIKFHANTSSLAVASLFGVGFDDPATAGGPEAPQMMIVGDFANNGGTETFLHGNNKSGGQGGNSAGNQYAASQFHRVVGRLTFNTDGVNDELLVWGNPTAESDSPIVNHNSQDLGTDMNGLTMIIAGRNIYGTPGWQADNLVLATSFGEALTGVAIPEPTTLALLAVSLAGCLVSRRRRR